MTGGTEFTEAAEITKDTPELVEAKENLNRATYDAPADVQAREDIQISTSEGLENELKDAVDAVPEALEAKPADSPSRRMMSKSTGSVKVGLSDQGRS